MIVIAGALVVACVLAEGFLRVGRVALRLVPGAGTGDGRPAVRLVTGWFACGTLLLGLAAAGLFRPVAVGGWLAAWFVAAGLATGRRPALPSLVGWLGQIDRRAAAAAILILGKLALRTNTPEMTVDCHIYHLGLSDGWRAAGKLLIDHIPFSQHFPLPFDASFGIPVLLGDDRISRWLVFFSFVGGLGLAVRSGISRLGAVLGIAMVLSLFQVSRFSTVSKNDIVATIPVVAGLLAVASRRRLEGWLLCGLGVAGKLVYAPLLAIAVLAWPPRRWRQAAVVAACFVLPILPWWIKSGLALGHPFVPVGEGWFPVVGWDERNWEAIHLHGRGFWIEQVWTPASFLRAYAKTWSLELLWLALAVPFAILGGGGRLLAVALAGGALTLLVSHVNRYLLPAIWVTALLVAAALARPGPRWRTRAAAGFAVAMFGFATGRLVLYPEDRSLRWRDAFRPPETVRAEHSLTRAELDRWIAAARPGRILTIGEVEANRFGGRVVYGGAIGETPLGWKLSREARSGAELAKRVHQLGVTTIVYNYVTAIWNRKYAYKFAWADDQLGRYVEFCGDHTRMVWASPHFDFVGGGFVALAVDRVARPNREPVSYLPGAEMLSLVDYDPAKGQAGRVSLERAVELTVRFPRALPNFADLGDFYARLERWPEAYQVLLPVWKARVRNSASMAAFGSVAGRLGRWDEAEAGLREAMATYASGEYGVAVGLAETILTRATVDGRHGRLDAAAGHALRAAAVINELPPAPTPAEAGRRTAILAVAAGLRADVARVRGRTAEAIALYREALARGPDIPGRDGWTERLRQLESGAP